MGVGGGGERSKVSLMLGAVSASVNTTSALRCHFPQIIPEGEVGVTGISQDTQLDVRLWTGIPEGDHTSELAGR